ncbi:MAG: hypothetical protein HQ582_07865 [Planctomycetes bacterium]|nr:hypothetical protein [Planctomycetota bacterium]
MDDWAWVLIPGLAVGFLGYLVGLGAEWGFSVIGLGVAPYPRIGLAGVGACFGLFLSVCIYRGLRGAANAVKADLENGLVEVIEVSGARVVQQEEYSDEGPILYFELDGETVLLLWGQWLFDPYVYGAEDHVVSDNAETFLNAQDRQFAFPCTDFTVHHCRKSRRVVKIEIRGEPLLPMRTLGWGDVPLQNVGDCEILRGTLDDLPAAMARGERAREP